MKKLRVMMLVHYSLVPPEDLSEDDPRVEKFRTEFDVKQALLELGHEVRVVGVYDDIAPIRATVESCRPHIAFNLLEDFAGSSAFDYFVVSYLEMLRLPYTGCNPRGLMLARDKALSKKILNFHKIAVPDFIIFSCGRRLGRRLRRLPFPMIVKALMEEGSVGIAQASYVENEAQLRERVALIHEKFKGDAIAEQYIDGRELYVTVLGNAKLEVLPIRELVFYRPDARGCRAWRRTRSNGIPTIANAVGSNTASLSICRTACPRTSPTRASASTGCSTSTAMRVSICA